MVVNVKFRFSVNDPCVVWNGTGRYVGNAAEFTALVLSHYGVQIDLTEPELRQYVEENKSLVHVN